MAVRFGGEVRVLVALEGRPEDYTSAIGNLITARRRRVPCWTRESPHPSGSLASPARCRVRSCPSSPVHDHLPCPTLRAIWAGGGASTTGRRRLLCLEGAISRCRVGMAGARVRQLVMTICGSAVQLRPHRALLCRSGRTVDLAAASRANRSRGSKASTMVERCAPGSLPLTNGASYLASRRALGDELALALRRRHSKSRMSRALA